MIFITIDQDRTRSLDKIGRCFFYSSDFRNPHKEPSLITYVRHQSLVRHRTNYNRAERKRCLMFRDSISNCGKDPEKVSSSWSSSTEPTKNKPNSNEPNSNQLKRTNQPKIAKTNQDSPVLNSFWPLSSQSQRRSFPLMSFAHFDFQISWSFLPSSVYIHVISPFGLLSQHRPPPSLLL